MLSSCFVLSLSVLAAVTPTGEAEWEANYGDALKQTRADDLPLLVVLDDPTDAEKRLDENLLDPTSGAFPLGSYDLCRIDVSTEYGKKVASIFRVSSFPHVAIIDKSGSVILKRVSGQVTEESWKETLAKYESGVRGSATTHTVAKPVVSQAVATQPVVSQPMAQPASYAVPAQAMPTRSYCPNCQLRGR